MIMTLRELTRELKKAEITLSPMMQLSMKTWINTQIKNSEPLYLRKFFTFMEKRGFYITPRMKKVITAEMKSQYSRRKKR